jgi:hypothetical protein
MVLVAYYPMLSRLRRRLVSGLPYEELDQIVVTAFLAAIRALSEREHRDRLTMRLRQRTEDQVFGLLRKEHMETKTRLAMNRSNSPTQNTRGPFPPLRPA